MEINYANELKNKLEFFMNCLKHSKNFEKNLYGKHGHK